MGYAICDDGVKLYFEETGSGFPVIFAHEFAGDYRSWEPQVRHLARRYRCITFNARGYPPSEVPQDPGFYSQDRARDDIAAVLDHLDIEKAHVVGLSMGSFAALHFGLRYPSRARSLVIAGCGYGAEPEQRRAFREEVEATAALFEKHGMEKGGPHYATGPTRLPFQAKDPRGFAEFLGQFQEHSLEGSVRTFLNVQKLRPSLWDLENELRALPVPSLIIVGDEDDPAIAGSLYLKRCIPAAGLLVLPKSGHTINLEEPVAFNRALDDFFAAVENKAWGTRDTDQPA